ncbi:MAG: hypothetical protein H7138_05045 [Myxococcales bacterium]|nr:hypothetical protein [Myxococcales bacterium]
MPRGGMPARRPVSPPIPRRTLARPEDEITSDFQIIEDLGETGDVAPTGSNTSLRLEPDSVAAGWRPLIDDDSQGSEAEPLLDSLLKTRVEPVPGDGHGDERTGPGPGPGLN